MTTAVPPEIISYVAWEGVKLELRSSWPSIQYMNCLWGKFCALSSMFPDNLEFMSRKNEAGFLTGYLARHKR